MDESRLAHGPQGELDSLKAAIGAFGGSWADAQGFEPELRAHRRMLAERFLTLGEERIEAQFAGPDGEALRLIVHCGLRDLERDADDEALAVRVRRSVGTAAPPAGELLAAMLLFQAYELPALEDLRA